MGARWIEVDDVANEALPTVMRKVVTHALRESSRSVEYGRTPFGHLDAMNAERDRVRASSRKFSS